MLTEAINITCRQMSRTIPGSANHQMNVAKMAKINSTYIPAAPITARCHLLGIRQLSETLQ